MNVVEINDKERGNWTSASNAQADSLCVARHLAQKGIPEDKGSDADFGNQIHKAMETGDDSALDPQQQSILESALKIEHDLLVRFFGPEIEGMKASPLREKRFWIMWADGLRHSGQVDVVYRWKKKALIIDLKSLRGEYAESPRNMQLRDLACLVDWNTPMLDEIGVAINQPLVTHKPDICVYSKADIMKAREQMYHRVDASNKGGEPTAGAVQCKWCRAKSNCKAYQQFAGSMVPVSKTLVDVPVSEWTPEMRKQFCDNFSVAQKWLDNCWSEMEKGAAQDPNFVPSYALVDGASRSKVTDIQKVFDRFSAAGGSLADFMAKTSITKTDLEALTRSATKLKGKALKDKIEEITEGCLQYSEVRKTLKPIKQ